MLPCGDKRGIDCWSLVASGGENFDKRCRDYPLWRNRGISEILGGGEEDSSLQTAVCLIERSELWMEEDWRSDGVQRSETEAE